MASTNINKNTPTPVITIDGPSASGKGTISHLVAQYLGWEVLDSGALYRLTALACLQLQININDQAAVAAQAAHMDVHFKNQQVYLNGKEVSAQLRAEEVGLLASKIASYPQVRTALLQKQREFRQGAGLVADGRDMGTVIFPDAPLKIYLVADVQSRAQRRYKQLMEKGISANLLDLLADLEARDLQDTTRSIAPLKAAPDAITLDSTALSIAETVAAVLAHWAAIQH